MRTWAANAASLLASFVISSVLLSYHPSCVGQDGVGLGAGTVAPMQRYVMSKEQWRRCRVGKGHADVVRARISKVSMISTIPNGTGWKASKFSRVSMMPVMSRVSMFSEGMPDEMVGRDRRSVSEPQIAF